MFRLSRSFFAGTLAVLVVAGLAAPLRAQTVLVDFGSDWRFARGTEEPSAPLTAWRENSFVDSGWEEGATGIGFGDDDDVTVLDDMRGSYTTVYLRQRFDVTGLAGRTALALGARFDDGLVCYLNGVEVLRVNAGVVGTDLAYDATADGNHEADAAEFFDISAGLAELVDGDNLIAVQLLNTSLTSTDLSFDVRLAFDDPSPGCPQGLSCTKTPSDVTLNWTNGAAVYDSIAVLRDGQPIAGSPFPGDTTSVIDSTPGDFQNSYSVLASIGGFTCHALECMTDVAFDLIEVGDDWRYFKGTEEPAADWNTAGFDDSSWETGPTGIGYGDGDDATILDDMEDGYLSVYCRRTFAIADPSVLTNLELRIDYDDGYIAYLNGVEVARSNSMDPADGPFAFNTPASAGREAGTASRVDVSAGIAELTSGENVLAVQVHNTGIGSTDVSFIPELSANDCTVRGLGCSLDEATDDVTLTWDAGTFEAIAIMRNGIPLPGSPFAGSTTSVVDDDPAPRDNDYEVSALIAGVDCAPATCSINCNERMPDALTCTLVLVDGVTSAQLVWESMPGATEVEIEREGALIATLGPDATSYLDPDVEVDEPEEDTGFAVIFVFPDATTCTINCNQSLCPEDFTCEIVEPAGVPRVRLSWTNMVKSWDTLSLLRDGEPLVDLPPDATEYVDVDVDLVPGEPHTYDFVPVAPLGGEVGTSCDASCSITMPFPEYGPFPAPAGDWDYALDLSGLNTLSYAEQTGDTGNIDGPWIRSVDRDEWDGSAPGEIGPAPGGPAPGGIGLEDIAGGGACGETTRVLRLINPGDTADPGTSLAAVHPEPYDVPGNSTLLLGLDLSAEPANVLRDGVTFAVRWRVTPAADSPEYLNALSPGDGSSVTNGLGHVGVYFVDDGSIETQGASASLAFALQSAGAIQVTTNPVTALPGIDVSTFHSLWVTIQDPEGDDTYALEIWVGGDDQSFLQLGAATSTALQTPNVDFGAAGTYLAIGVPDAGGDADLQFDLVAYKLGVHAPARGSCGPVGDELFRRGDADDSGGANITDAIAILNYLFGGGGGGLTCPDAADIDDSGKVNITDAVRLLNFLFGGGPGPELPGNLQCGGDPSADDLATCIYESC